MIYLGADHAGFDLKEKVKGWLKGWGYAFEDMGPFQFDKEDDYPDFAHAVAKAVALRQDQGDYDARGIVIGGSGQGEAMVPNRYRGIRAAVYYGGPIEIIRLSRTHNNANVLGVGARFVQEEELKEALRVWLETPFPDPADSNSERHSRRIQKIDSGGEAQTWRK